MNANQKLFLALIISNAVSFVFAALFVIFYFRIYPNQMMLVFPIVFVIGAVFGIIYYPSVKGFLEKKEEKK